MKTNFLLFFFFISVTAFAQETYIMKSGGRIFNSKGERLTSIQVAENFEKEALEMYRKGRTKKTVGNLFLWGGIVTGFTKLIVDSQTPIKVDSFNFNGSSLSEKESSNVLYYVSGAMILIAVPIKIGFQKKIKQSVEMMHSKVVNSDKTTIESSTIIANSNGLGIQVTF